jgi:excinuclease ABC subunit A
MADVIRIQGAREHNLQNITLELPRNKMVVITGLSGSGKSSLAFDTLYAEGQRRYVESLSSYARQFLGLMEKPDVDVIEGLSPAISIDQKGTSRNPRSTVGTVTEIYDYLRLLFARIGQPHDPVTGEPITSQTVDEMVDRILSMEEGTRLMILAPVVRGRKGEYRKLFSDYAAQGFARARVDGEIVRLDAGNIDLERYVQHTIEIVVDRVVVKPGSRSRISEAVEKSLEIADGIVSYAVLGEGQEILSVEEMSARLSLSDGSAFPEVEPRLFSFNSPFGACPDCNGLGFSPEFDADLVVPNPDLSLGEGALAPWGKPKHSMRHHARATQFWRRCERAMAMEGISMRARWRNLTQEQRSVILNGTHGFSGVLPALDKMYAETESEYFRSELEQFMTERPCHVCHGARLRPESLAVKIRELSIAGLTDMSVVKALRWIRSLELSAKEMAIAAQVFKELEARLHFLDSVGLDYLTLSRAARTLSGGEAQRIRLATQIGSGLVGVMYILDEPSIGLHQRDNERLLSTLMHLRELGNTLILVEHDEDTIRAADHVVDIGPGAGIHGGRVVAEGTPQEIARNKGSLTGDYLSGRKRIEVPAERHAPENGWIRISGASENNLKGVDAAFPIGLFTCVTGVSGSGKSTLVDAILRKALAMHLNGAREKPGAHLAVEGLEGVDKAIVIDQTPIGRTPRSNPATYTGLFDPIRQIFAKTPEARMRGYQPGRFSFNVKGGRCEACQGQGILKIEMHFLPDVYVPCEVCAGKRYNRETLEVRYKGKTISEVLDMTIDEALELFTNVPAIRRRLQTIVDVGLGYISLGQAATTLSGGEAQRVKLATELSKVATGRTVYLLDEPTTGLHFHDVARLLKVLERLTEGGNTVITIEHNLDVIKCADWLIDLGPEGGDRGGTVLVSGSPETIAACPHSYTGQFLAPMLGVERPGAGLAAAGNNTSKKNGVAAATKRTSGTPKKSAGKKRSTKAKAAARG